MAAKSSSKSSKLRVLGESRTECEVTPRYANVMGGGGGGQGGGHPVLPPNVKTLMCSHC